MSEYPVLKQMSYFLETRQQVIIFRFKATQKINDSILYFFSYNIKKYKRNSTHKYHSVKFLIDAIKIIQTGRTQKAKYAFKRLCTISS